MLGNCISQIVHRALVLLDYTPKTFRFIDPTRRKYQFPGVDVPVGNPDFRPPIIPVGESPQLPNPTPEEPRSPRAPFGPEQDPGEIPQSPNPSNPQSMGALRPVRVVTDIKRNVKKKRVEVEYSIIWCWFGGVEKVVPLYGESVNVISKLRVANNKLYGDVRRTTVLSAGDLLEGEIVIEGVTCDTTSPSTNPGDPGYTPGGV